MPSRDVGVLSCDDVSHPYTVSFCPTRIPPFDALPVLDRLDMTTSLGQHPHTFRTVKVTTIRVMSFDNWHYGISWLKQPTGRGAAIVDVRHVIDRNLRLTQVFEYAHRGTGCASGFTTISYPVVSTPYGKSSVTLFGSIGSPTTSRHWNE